MNPIAGRGDSHVAILMSTLQGERFLGPQLDSIAVQSHADWHLHVSDDGSTDATLELLAEYRRDWGSDRMSIRSGPRRGFCLNFLSLACASDIDAAYYAYSDQDDLWSAAKLERAVDWISSVPQEVPALYCGRTRLVDERGRPIGRSPLFARPANFENALVQSIAGGNTMLFNRKARELLVEAGPDLDVQTHDWWAYLVVSGCGGIVRYDTEPMVDYRQHDSNLVGSNVTLAGRALRVRRLVEGRFREMNSRNLEALGRLRHRLSPQTTRVLSHFKSARNSSLPARVAGILRSGVYCQTTLGNMGLAAATVLRKL
jgi:glycosyltransferase involved in cell wall biosynthesis